MANHVARIAFTSFVDSYVALCARRGRPRHDVLRGAEDLSARSSLDWSEWVGLIGRVEAALEGPHEIAELVEIWSERAPSLGVFRKVLSRFVSPEQVVRGVWVWSGPQMFRPPVARASFEGERARLSLELPEGFAPCLFFFEFSALSTALLPVLIGLPPAIIEEKVVTPRSLSLVMRLPPSRTPWAWLAAFWGRRKEDGVLADALIDAHQQSRAERSLLASLLARSRDGVVVVRGGIVVETNDAARELVGVAAGAVCSAELDRLVRAAEGGETLQRVHAGTAQERWIRTWRTAAEGSGDVLFLRDVTDSEAARREMEQMQRYASLGETGAVIGHEIATMMTAVRGEVQWCLEHGAERPDTVAPSLGRALDGATQAARAARNLLVPANKRESADGAHDLGGILRSALDIVSWTARDHQVALTTEGPGQAILVRCAATDVILVLVNLLKNAVEAAATSGARRVRVVWRVEASACEVDVEDSGDGLPDALGGRWGELAQEPDAGPKGHGIGLVVARRLASRNGAMLSYGRDAGWTRFQLRLRRTQEA